MRALDLKNDHEVSRFEAMAECVRMVAAAAETEEADLGEVPEEFIDPIMATLMRDPVKLPSGHRCDRAIISRHLLTDQTDPFSRQALTVSQLETDDDLRGRIETWMAEKRGRNRTA